MGQKTVNIKNDTNPILIQVLDILGIKKDPFENVDEDYRTHIDTILKDNPKAKKSKELALYLINEVDVKFFYRFDSLREDKDIILAALKKDSSIYAGLPTRFQSQLLYAQEAIKSLVREKTNFVEIEKFLTQYFGETKMFTQLFEFYKKYLKIAEYFFQSDTERLLIILREKYPNLYTIIFEKKLLEQQGKKIRVTDKFTEFFLSQTILFGEMGDISEEEKQKKYLKIFQNYLQLSEKEMTEELLVFFTSILNLLYIKKQKKKEQDDEKKEQQKDTEVQIYEDTEEELDNRLEFCIPHCHYSIGSNGSCNIQLGKAVFLSLSAEEISRINDTALKNYISGVARLTELGLGFGLKYREQFFNICDVNPLLGEGLSEAKLLKILNKVGKKIGIPERSFTEKKDEEGEEKKEIGCFNRLEEAVYQFRQIVSSGTINNKHICDIADKGNRSIIEIALIQKGYFDAQGKGFLKRVEW